MRDLVLITLILTFTAARLPADDTNTGRTAPAATVTIGHARFTALTPRLIRMEWSPDSTFEDRPSLAFFDRTPAAEFTAVLTLDMETHGVARSSLKTSELELLYTHDGRPFHEGNLSIIQTFKHEKNPNVWNPGKRDTGNLLGTFRTLDGVNGSTQLEKGILSRDGWAIVDDSGKPAFDKLNGRQWFAERKNADALDWYYFGYGHDYKEALADFTKFAGKIPLPPRFVFGAWWSRYWAYSDAELRELVAEFKANDVPLDILVIDMDWHLDGWTGYTWNPKYFPDPEGFLKWAHEQGLKVTLNLHPADGVGKQEKAFPEVCKAMGLDPEKTEKIPFDCTDPKFVDAYFKYLHHPLEKMGIDFWWMDWQQGGETKIKNLDPLMALNHLHWQDMADRAEETGKRPLIFSRWGGLGNHRYQIGFSGDTFCNWPSLAFQPYFTATAGNVGYAYWSHDIGGHQPGPVDPELYVRWIQWGALSPILRTHTTKNPLAERRIWKFPKEYFEAARKAYQFRYELIPYIYTMARKCHDTGIPLCRPLYYEWPEMDEAYTWKNEYMFGDDLLVSPVVEPADPISGCAMVEVWLPPGKWVNWFTGRQYEGPTTARLVVPLDEMPLFARAGAVIPTKPFVSTNYVLCDHPDFFSNESVSSQPSPRRHYALNIFAANTGKCDVYDDCPSQVGKSIADLCGVSVNYIRKGKQLNLEFLPKSEIVKDKSVDIQWELRLFNTCTGAKTVSVNAESLSPEQPERDEFVILSAGPDGRYGTSDDKKSYETFDGPAKWRSNPDVDGPVIVLPPADVSTKQDVEIALEYSPDELQRLPFRTLNSVRSKIDELVPPNGEIPFPPNDKEKLPDLEQLSLNRLLDSKLNDQDKQRWASRMLGIFRRIKFTPANELKEGNQVAIQLEITNQIAGFDNCDTEVTLTNGGQKIEPVPSTTKPNPRNGLATYNFPVPSLTQTTSLDGEIKLNCNGHTITLPVSQTLLPSIAAWQILGPFDVPFIKSFDTKFPPEDKIDLAAEYDGKDNRKIKWQLVERKITPDSNLADEFFIDFDDVFNGRVYECVAYALTYLDAPEDCDAVLAFGTDDGCIVRLNGEEVFRVNVGRPYTSKQNRVPVKLKKGENELLLKINQGGGDWGFCVHLESPDGKPLTQVRTRTTSTGE